MPIVRYWSVNLSGFTASKVVDTHKLFLELSFQDDANTEKDLFIIFKNFLLNNI